jgi:hypothetical protein
LSATWLLVAVVNGKASSVYPDPSGLLIDAGALSAVGPGSGDAAAAAVASSARFQIRLK